MKKMIFIYDAGVHKCSVEITIDVSKINSLTRLMITYLEVVYEVSYVVGMDYGIIIPEHIVHYNNENSGVLH